MSGACGDAIVADDDGVVVVPHDAVAQTIAVFEERLRREETKRARLAAGELSLDIENMRPKLEQLGSLITTILIRYRTRGIR